MTAKSMLRRISVTNASGFDNYFVARVGDLSSDGHFRFQWHGGDDKPGRFGIHFDFARTVAQAKPAAGHRAFLDQAPRKCHLGWGIPRPYRQNGLHISRGRFSQNGALLPVAARD